MKALKRYFVMLLAVATVISPMTVFAKGTDVVQHDESQGAVVSVASEAVSRASIGKVLATGTATIHGTGTLTLTLPSGNWWADFSAGVVYASGGAMISCSVRTPNGDTFNLGNMYGAGSKSGSYELTYAPAGTYTFYFSSTVSEYQVVAYIYD